MNPTTTLTTDDFARVPCGGMAVHEDGRRAVQTPNVPQPEPWETAPFEAFLPVEIEPVPFPEIQSIRQRALFNGQLSRDEVVRLAQHALALEARLAER